MSAAGASNCACPNGEVIEMFKMPDGAADGQACTSPIPARPCNAAASSSRARVHSTGSSVPT
jgi:hypothetical protein